MKDINELKSEISDRTAQITEEIKHDLKEAAHWFGGWDELRKKVDELEQLDIEAANDRFMDPERA